MSTKPSDYSPPDLVSVRRALISVYDKTGIVELAQALTARGVEIVSTGGTRAALSSAGIATLDVSQVTGFPEILDGRVKTLHPAIHAGLLAVRDDAGHRQTISEHDIAGIDLLVVNLYPFESTVASGADGPSVIENIDIGGPALIRAAAKNHDWVTVLTDPEDNAAVLAELETSRGATSFVLRRSLAAKAFARTAAYDSAIANWFAMSEHDRTGAWWSLYGRRAADLRYAENPHQSGALYIGGAERPGVATARQLQGKQLSYNNIADTDAAYELVAEFDPGDSAAVAIVKHANPCGVALAENLTEAYRLALRCDPVSAFGGVIAMNRKLDRDTARAIADLFTEVIIAPDADGDAIALLAGRKNLRLLLAGSLPDPRAPSTTVRSVAGGFLVQDRDVATVSDSGLRVVTRRKPDAREIEDMLFAWKVAKHVKSNAIVYAKDRATVGIGAGQMSRLDSAIIASRKAEEAARAAGLAASLAAGAVCASDAFFPFPDGLIVAAEAGVTAFIQPGGSVRDDEVVAAADDRGAAMVFTGVRHFRH
jgi:phosphoribosylaminoimidazolecarboxamide formyltransferase/IMP cyclohydrolase